MSCGGSGTTINYPLDINVTLTQPLAGDGSSIGNLNASNLAFGHVNSSLIYGNTLSNISASNITQPFTNLTTTNDALIGPVRVGIGANNVPTDTVLGANVLLNDFGIYDTAIGYASMSTSQPFVGYDTALGALTLQNDTGPGYNTAIGSGSMVNSHPNQGQDVAVGFSTLQSDTGAGYNTAIGTYSMKNSNPGAGNDTAIGYYTLSGDNGPGYNTAVGGEAMQSANPGGGYDTGVGWQALQNDTGSYNTAIGANAGQGITGGTYNTALGAGSGPYSSSLNYTVSIGSNAQPTISNVAVFPYGINVGINTGSPGSSLEVQGNIYASNSFQTTNIFVKGNLYALNFAFGNTLSNLNASNLAFGIVKSSLIYGNTLSNIQFSNIVGLLPNTISNLNASNLAFGVVNSSLIYGNTLSNVSASNIVQPFSNLVSSNAVKTTNVFASGNVVIGPPVTSVLANLHVEQSDIFIGNSAVIGSNFASVGSNRLIFDNSSNTANGPNKIVLFSNTVGNFGAGIGVFNLTGTTASVSYWTYNSHYFYAGPYTSPYVVGGFTNGSTFTVGTTPSFNAKFYVTGGAPSTNIMARIDASSNVALATSGGGLVGISTLTPSANLHVLGNVYASNALSTTNIFANTMTLSNSLITTSKFMGTSNPGYLPGVFRQEWSLSNTTVPGIQSGFDLNLQTATQTANSWVYQWINQSTTVNSLTVNFSWIYTGSIYVSNAGSYTFLVDTDDSGDVFIRITPQVWIRGTRREMHYLLHTGIMYTVQG
jgi:hypothetical protein